MTIELPHVAYGTWQLDDTQAETCVARAIRDGYRMVDTAQRYHNEFGVGEGVRLSGIPRSEIIVTSKLRGGDQEQKLVKPSFFASLRNLGLAYIDIYYIHWPLPWLGLYPEAYRQLMELRDDGYIRHIGVCNFSETHLRRIESECGEFPVVNQVELHPGFAQHQLTTFCKNNGIAVQGWGVIGRGKGMLEDPTIEALSRKYEITPAQLCIAWARTRNYNVIAKSATRSRWLENLDARNLEISESDVAALDSINWPRESKDPDVDPEY